MRKRQNWAGGRERESKRQAEQEKEETRDMGEKKHRKIEKEQQRE